MFLYLFIMAMSLILANGWHQYVVVIMFVLYALQTF